MRKNLVAYFSVSGNTAYVAKNLAEITQADLYEIKPKNPYSSSDVNWNNPNSRSSIEMKDKFSRPEIEKLKIDMKGYQTIYLGFPIWWYTAPTIINTFLETYDFSHKKIVLFATSGGSGFGNTVENLKDSVDESTLILEGKVLNSQYSIDDLKTWVNHTK